METILLDGRAASSALLDGLKPLFEGKNLKLVIVQVGEDPASSSYIKQKVKSSEKVGLLYEHRHLPEDCSWEDLQDTVEELNSDDSVTGFIVQLPLPKHLKEHEEEVIALIDPTKDVDGFHPSNIGEMFLGTEMLCPATPSGVVALLEYYEIAVEGADVCILGRSNIVGKPLAAMLINRGATVTVCNSKTADLSSKTLQADIVVAAIGKPKFVTKDMVREGAVVIDVGINRLDDGSLVGDCDIDALQGHVSAITPVPGGVGPMTVAALIGNSAKAARL